MGSLKTKVCIVGSPLPIGIFYFLFSSAKKQLKIPTAKVRATHPYAEKNPPSKNLQI